MQSCRRACSSSVQKYWQSRPIRWFWLYCIYIESIEHDHTRSEVWDELFFYCNDRYGDCNCHTCGHCTSCSVSIYTCVCSNYITLSLSCCGCHTVEYIESVASQTVIRQEEIRSPRSLLLSTFSKVHRPIASLVRRVVRSCLEACHTEAVQQPRKRAKCRKIILAIVFSHQYELS